ncbi:hypothetical protein DZK27_08490 [Rhodobacteraceae bacterium 63075]|nr:hypothetical protein DZK27_08490 [Rhodobacteraceae bacterium 63075]
MARNGWSGALTVTWQNREIAVTFEENWLGGALWHIELRCDDILPVPETGYRSAFVDRDAIPEKAAIAAFVLAWLDEAATDPAWPARLEASPASSSSSDQHGSIPYAVS